MNKHQRTLKLFEGISILELLLASGLFVIIATTGLTTVIYTFSSNRLGEEESKATFLAQEGIEAVRSIKKAGWANLVAGTYGLDFSSGEWMFSGTSDSTGKFTRQVLVGDVYRNGDGDIVDSGGTLDPSARKVISQVSWSFTTARVNTVGLTVYLTNWERLIPIGGGGMLVYADYSGADDVIKYKIFSSDGSWGDEQTVPDFGVSSSLEVRRIELYSSATRDENVLISKHTENGQYIYAQVWDGSSWGNVVALTHYSDNTNPETRNFDGAYLDNGDFIVVYDDFTFTPKYRVWDGSNWSSEMPTSDIGGFPVWIVVRNSPGTNNAMAVVRDHWRDTNTIYWDGTSWSSAVQHGSFTFGFSMENVSFEWSLNNPEIGGLMYSDAWLDYYPDIKIWREDNSWGPEAENVYIGGIVESVQIVSRPGSDEFLGCVKDSKRDINCLKTGFSPRWQAVENGEVAKNTDGGVQRSFSLAYEAQSGDLALVVYSEGGETASRRIPKYRTYDPSGSVWSSSGVLPELGADASHALETVRLISDPNSNDIIVLMGDSDQDLTSVVWNGSANEFYSVGDRGMVKHGEYGSNDVDFWFDFAWDSN